MLDNRDYYFSKFWVGRPEDDVAVVIDGANLGYMTRKLMRASVDYKEFSHILYANFPGLRSIHYIVAEFLRKEDDRAQTEREFTRGYSPIRSLLMWLRHNRYTVTSREIFLSENHNGRPSIEYTEHHMDVEITMALYKAARHVKHIVFVGSSKKFAAPLKDLKDMGLTVTVIGVKRPETPPVLGYQIYTADELREVDNFVDLFDPFFERMLKRRNTIETTARDSGSDSDISAEDLLNEIA